MNITVHENDGEWVLRLNDGAGSYVSLGALVGEQEARAVQAVLQGAIELHAECSRPAFRPDDQHTRGYWSGMRQANKCLDVDALLSLLK